MSAAAMLHGRAHTSAYRGRRLRRNTLYPVQACLCSGRRNQPDDGSVYFPIIQTFQSLDVPSVDNYWSSTSCKESLAYRFFGACKRAIDCDC